MEFELSKRSKKIFESGHLGDDRKVIVNLNFDRDSEILGMIILVCLLTLKLWLMHLFDETF